MALLIQRGQEIPQPEEEISDDIVYQTCRLQLGDAKLPLTLL